MAFSSKDEVDEVAVLNYIHEAIENNNQGKNLKPEKGKSIVSQLFTKGIRS